MLRRVLPSYLAVRADEILVVDDGSGPPHDAILAELEAAAPPVRVVRLPRHVGLPAARNAGVDATEGEWIVFGEDDVWFLPDYPSTLIEHAELAGARAAAGVVPLVHPALLDGPRERLEAAIRAGSTPHRPHDAFLGASWPVELLGTGDVVTPLLTATAAVHRSVFQEVRYDPGYRGNALREETDFFLSCSERGIRTIHCPHASAGHLKEHARAAPGGSWAMGPSRYAWQMAANNWRLLRKHNTTIGAARRAAGRSASPVVIQAGFLLGMLGRIRPRRPQGPSEGGARSST